MYSEDDMTTMMMITVMTMMIVLCEKYWFVICLVR